MLAAELETVVAVVEAHLTQRTPPAATPCEADRVGILDALRRHLLEEWPAGEADALLPTMRAMEDARAQLHEGSAPPLSPGVLTPYGYRLMREVAHTLRSPMGSLVMLAGSLKDGVSGDLNDMQRKHLGIIHRASMSLANMANDLLSMAGEEDGLDDDPGPLRIDEVMWTVADSVGPVAEERGLDLTVRAPGGGVRLGRARPLGRTLMNLALNAALLARDGALELAAEEAGDTVKFIVHAAAAAPEDGDVFRVFQTPGDADKYTLSRSGLGFSTARHLVRRMGSEIESEWSQDHGLSLAFALRLPLQV